jgi:D-sedoheptulose 7-phosphate isomerase
MNKTVNDLISLYFKEKSNIALNFPSENITLLYQAVKNTYDNDGIVYILGNGGSASIAEGFVVDLRTHPFVLEDKSITTEIRRIKVVSLTESSGLLTGISNDVGFDYVFSEQMKNFSRSGSMNSSSLLICLTGSGNSPNAINAINYAKDNGIKTSTISGRGGGKAAKIVDIPVLVDGSSDFPGQTGKNNNNFHIEDFQNSISHIVVGLLKRDIEKSS